MKLKRMLGLFLAMVLVCSLLAPVALAEGEKRNIVIGLWWDRYYDSTSKALEDNPSYQGLESDQLMFDVVKKVEEKYNVTIEYVNMTYVGLRESVNTSILAGTPECDIYLVDTSIGIPAAMNGYCIDLKSILPEGSDIFGGKAVMNYLDLGDGGAYLMKPVAAQSLVEEIGRAHV